MSRKSRCHSGSEQLAHSWWARLEPTSFSNTNIWCQPITHSGRRQNSGVSHHDMQRTVHRAARSPLGSPNGCSPASTSHRLPTPCSGLASHCMGCWEGHQPLRLLCHMHHPQWWSCLGRTKKCRLAGEAVSLGQAGTIPSVLSASCSPFQLFLLPCLAPPSWTLPL